MAQADRTWNRSFLRERYHQNTGYPALKNTRVDRVVVGDMADPELEAIRQVGVLVLFVRSLSLPTPWDCSLQKRLADLASCDHPEASLPPSVISKLAGNPPGGAEEETKKAAENEE